MKTEFEGYVVYCNDLIHETPLGVVSENFECKAESYYVPNRLKKFIVEIEDKRFYKHNGIDLKAVLRAIVVNIISGKIVQGGSTISQQLARNLLRNNQKTVSRKIQESIKALQIESIYSKDEILDQYFGNIYFGKNIWGLRTAGIFYFGKEVENLTYNELLYLLTILRGPNFYSNHLEITKKRSSLLNRLLYEKKLISKNIYCNNNDLRISKRGIKISAIKSACVPFISNKIDSRKKRIITSINLRVQEFAKKFVVESKYPVSIIAIRNGRVVAFASSYGSDYPFMSKSNVGSTLKPFLYCHLRNNGISKSELFDASQNELNWDVREVEYNKTHINIQEALLLSNNNSFINAVCKAGLEESLSFLAKLFGKSEIELFPSSILGATKSGISLYELACAYSVFFKENKNDSIKIECLRLLNKVFYKKLGLNIENAFLKTGTTNKNKERYAVLGKADLTFAILRNEYKVNDETKEGSFMKQISASFASIFNPKNNFVWI